MRNIPVLVLSIFYDAWVKQKEALLSGTPKYISNFSWQVQFWYNFVFSEMLKKVGEIRGETKFGG